jgi:diguanylate cyclase (GGDEF)-like protein
MTLPAPDPLPSAATPRELPWRFVLYAGIAAMLVAALAVAVSAVDEIRRLSRTSQGQSLWHVYQTHDAVQKVAGAAQAVAEGRTGPERLRIDLELLAAQTAAVREFRMLDLQLPQYGDAWRSIEQAVTEGLAVIDAEGPFSADRARALAERFGALRETSRFLMSAAQQEANQQRDLARTRLKERFWQGAAALAMLAAGLIALLWRAHKARQDRARLTERLLDLNRTLEERVEQRTHDLEVERLQLSTILESSPSAIALLRAADAVPIYFNARMRQALALETTPTTAFTPTRLFASSDVADEVDGVLRDGRSLHDREAVVAGKPPFHALVTALRVMVKGEPAGLIWLHDHSRHRQLELELQHQAATDPLTTLANRRAFFDEGPRMLERARRYRHACSMLMIDVDHFKAVNDRHGHHAGDQVLRALADRLREVLRQADLVARLGGEEFAALMPETEMPAALLAAERVRQICQAIGPQLDGFADMGVSVSIGVAQWRPGETLDHLLERADAALYRAKRGGRNRVESS